MSDTYIVTKDAAPKAGQDPTRREGGHRYLDGAVNLLRFRRDPHWGVQPARIADVARTIDCAIDSFAELAAEAIATGDGELGREVDDVTAKVADLTRRLERVEAANAALAERNAGLTREVELMQRLDRDRRASAAAKPRKPKPKSSDAVGLPAFVMAGPVKRGAAVEAPPGAEAAS